MNQRSCSLFQPGARRTRIAMTATLIALGAFAGCTGSQPARDGCGATLCPSAPFDLCAEWPGCSQGLCYGDLGFVWSGGRCVRLLGCHGSSPAPDRTYAECVMHHASCANAIVATTPPCTADGGLCTGPGAMECSIVDADGGTGCVPILAARGCGIDCAGAPLFCP